MEEVLIIGSTKVTLERVEKYVQDIEKVTLTAKDAQRAVQFIQEIGINFRVIFVENSVQSDAREIIRTIQPITDAIIVAILKNKEDKLEKSNLIDVGAMRFISVPIIEKDVKEIFEEI